MPLNFLERLVSKILNVGKIPKHLAIIMDGNRRFARKNNVDTKSGHLAGCDKLIEVNIKLNSITSFILIL